MLFAVPEGQQRERNPAVRDPTDHSAHGAVAASDDDQVRGLLQRPFPAVLFRRLVAHLVARVTQQLAQALAALVLVPGAGVVDQRN
jgi:hypothetical protein